MKYQQQAILSHYSLQTKYAKSIIYLKKWKGFRIEYYRTPIFINDSRYF